MTGLRAITRLAVRESCRRPGRSLLVIALIALPAAAAVFVSTWLHTAVDSPQEQVESQLGQADLVVYANPGREAPTRDLLAGQHGWRVVALSEGTGLVSAPRSGRLQLRFRALDIPLADPLVRGISPRVVGGRPPAVPGEVAVSRSLLRVLGSRVGDTITTIRPAGTYSVTGVLDTPEYLNTIAGPGVNSLVGGSRLLVDTPGPVVLPDALRDGQTLSQTRAELLASAESGRTNDRVFLYLYGALGMAAFGLIVSAALAIGARRQLRALGLIGANGASPSQAGLLTLMQGALLGVVGAVAGVMLGIGSSYALRPVVERLTDQAEGPIDLQPVDCFVIAILAVVIAVGAAWLPARVAARTSVLQALGGRKTLSRLGVRVPLGGLVVSVLGCLMLGWAAAGVQRDRDTAIAVVGAGFIIAGLVVCSPYLVGLLERVASRTSGTLRLAARTVARQRSRTGPTVAAIMAAGALAIAAATVSLTDDRRAQRAFAADAFAPPRDEVTVDISAFSVRLGPPDTAAGNSVGIGCPDVPQQLTVALESAVGEGTARCLSVGFGSVGKNGSTRGVAVVDPRSAASVLAASDLAALKAGKVVALSPPGTDPFATGNLIIERRGREIRIPVVHGAPRSHVSGGYLDGLPLVAPATARRIGVRTSHFQTLLQMRTARALTSSQRDRLTALSADDLGAQFSNGDRDVYVNFQFAQPPSTSDVQLVTYEVILPAAMLLALLTVWIGLALTAAETRDERATFVAVGAGPAHRRCQNAWQAVLVTGLGALLAVPGGLIPAAIVLNSGDGGMATSIAISPPWVILLALVVGLPLLAAGGSALLTRGKMSPLIRRSV